MIGSAANSGQAMLASLRGGASPKTAGDAAIGFDAVVAGLGAAPGKGHSGTDAAQGEILSSPTSSPAVAAIVAVEEVAVDPVAAAAVIQELVVPSATVLETPPAAATSVPSAPVVTPISQPAPAVELPVGAPALAAAEPTGDAPDIVVAGPIPALPPEKPVAPSTPSSVTGGMVASPFTDRSAEPEPGIADADNAHVGGTDGGEDDGAERPSADSAPALAPAVVPAPWLPSLVRVAPQHGAAGASADSPPRVPNEAIATPVPVATAPAVLPPMAMPAIPDPAGALEPSQPAPAFVVRDLFAASADALPNAAVAPVEISDGGTDPIMVVTPLPARFTPLVTSSTPIFTPLAAMADGVPAAVVASGDGVVRGDDAVPVPAAAPADRVADISAPLAPAPLPTAQAGSAQLAAISIAGADVAQQVAGHQLDLARDSAWLDQLARDIVAAGAQDTKLSFKLNPEHLGSLHVEVLRGDDGASVRLTTENESARAALADAQGRLVAEARAHGMKIAETHVDLSQQGNGQGQRNWADGQSGQPNPQPQPARVNAPVTMTALDEETAHARTGPRERYA